MADGKTFSDFVVTRPSNTKKKRKKKHLYFALCVVKREYNGEAFKCFKNF